MKEDTLLLESDLVFEESLVDVLLEDPRSNLALVDKYESWMDGTCMVLDENDCIVDFIPGKHLKYDKRETYYKTVNIYKFSREFSGSTYIPFLEAYAKAHGFAKEEVAYVGDDYGLGGNDESVLLAGYRFFKVDDYREFPEVVAELL